MPSESYADVSEVIRHVWSEPKFVAQIEWLRDHPPLSMQLEEQMGRGAMEHYVATGQHLEPDRKLTFVQYEEPDWDWWEPTTEWRRVAARNREWRANR